LSKKVRNTIKVSVGTALGAPVVLVFLSDRSFGMDVNHAFAFAVAVSLFSMLVIAGAALMGTYRFLKNVGVFKGHYYY
jgi:hypothetical protein